MQALMPFLRTQQPLSHLSSIYSGLISAVSHRLQHIAIQDRKQRKPEEPGPEDCCQAGCTRCVWEAYLEELQAWEASQSGAKIKRKLDPFLALEMRLKQEQKETAMSKVRTGP
eukprot:jgi/Ulvmu1/6230/UM028_0088.1